MNDRALQMSIQLSAEFFAIAASRADIGSSNDKRLFRYVRLASPHLGGFSVKLCIGKEKEDRILAIEGESNCVAEGNNSGDIMQTSQLY